MGPSYKENPSWFFGHGHASDHEKESCFMEVIISVLQLRPGLVHFDST